MTVAVEAKETLEAEVVKAQPHHPRHVEIEIKAVVRLPRNLKIHKTHQGQVEANHLSLSRLAETPKMTKIIPAAETETALLITITVANVATNPTTQAIALVQAARLPMIGTITMATVVGITIVTIVEVTTTISRVAIRAQAKAAETKEVVKWVVETATRAETTEEP